MSTEYNPIIGEKVYTTYEKVIASKKDRVGILTLNDPERANVLGRAMIRDIGSALRELQEDDGVQVIVLNAIGKHFCSGFDVTDWLPLRENRTELAKYIRFFHENLFGALQKMSRPLISAVQGKALAGGAGIGIRIPDIVVISEETEVAFTGINAGASCLVSVGQLERAVGMKKTREWILTGRLISAQECLDSGLVNKVVPVEKLGEAAMEYAELIASKAPLATMVTKTGFNRMSELMPAEAEAYAYTSVFYELVLSEDCKEGIAAFKEKRAPKWKGQ